MYGCESWTIKKAEHWITDAFKLWCWRRLLRVTWTARRSKQSILNEINTKFSLEGFMLKWQLQYFGQWMLRADSLGKNTDMEKVEDRRRKGRQRTRWLDGITDSMDMIWSKFQEIVKEREAWHAAVHGVAKSWTGLSNWTTRKYWALNIQEKRSWYWRFSIIQSLFQKTLMFLFTRDNEAHIS